jgi:hypothetical protein
MSSTLNKPSINENNELLQSVLDVFSKYLHKNQVKCFNVPEYQRGYKWTKEWVDALLDDINDADVEGEKFYCLQNITIIKKDEKFNVIDGQQRLTTLFIILSYLGKSNLIKDKIKYSIRTETHNFLTAFVATRKIWEENFETYQNFIDLHKEYDKPDTYYIFNAARTIESWFVNNTDNKVSEKLEKKVKFIVNNLFDKTSEETIFRNLNSDKVPLDGADLVRAIIVTRVANELINSGIESTKTIVATNEYRVKIGMELDHWNNWWSKSDVQEYFDLFTDNKAKSNAKKNRFNTTIYPINQLYLLYVASIIKPLELKTFEKGHDSNNKSGDDTLEMYKAILKLHHTLQDWYKDREIYHYLGYLFAQFNTVKFKDIWDKWNQSQTRDDFKSELRKLIKKMLFSKNDGESNFSEWLENIKDVKYNWFTEKKLYELLILLDVINLSEERDNDNDLPFMKAKYFVKQKGKASEDKEHILPQTPNPDKEDERIDKFSVDEISAFLDDLTKMVSDKNENDKNEIQKILISFKAKAKDDEAIAKQQVYREINRLGLNSIGNIVLLHHRPNRQYKNNPYLDKRGTIIDNLSNGVYIRPHTLTTFVKQTNNEQIDIWNLKDIETNANYIATAIEKYLKE